MRVHREARRCSFMHLHGGDVMLTRHHVMRRELERGERESGACAHVCVWPCSCRVSVNSRTWMDDGGAPCFISSNMEASHVTSPSPLHTPHGTRSSHPRTFTINSLVLSFPSRTLAHSPLLLSRRIRGHGRHGRTLIRGAVTSTLPGYVYAYPSSPSPL